MIRRLSAYALASALVLAIPVFLLAVVVTPWARDAVLLAGGLALFVQLVAFLALLGSSRRINAFLLAWGGGSLLRMAIVLGAGLWLARGAALPAAPFLLSLAGFFFLLLLLEPFFLPPQRLQR